MKFNKIKTLTMVVAVLTLGTFAGCGKEDTKTVIKYVEAVPSPAVTQAPVSVEEPTEEPSTLTHDEIINGIKTILQNNWEYSDVDYNVNSDTLHAYISKPQITSSMNKIPYNKKLKEKWATETQISLRELNTSMVDLYRKNGYSTHVTLNLLNGYQHEELILCIHDGVVVYDKYLKIDIYDVDPTF